MMTSRTPRIMTYGLHLSHPAVEGETTVLQPARVFVEAFEPGGAIVEPVPARAFNGASRRLAKREVLATSDEPCLIDDDGAPPCRSIKTFRLTEAAKAHSSDIISRPQTQHALPVQAAANLTAIR